MTAPPSVDGEDTRPLPNGWIAEMDPSTGRIYYVDTMSLSPQATWNDPRTNPALYVSHDPEMGVTVSHQTIAPNTNTTAAATAARNVVNVNVNGYGYGHGHGYGHEHEYSASPVSSSDPSQLASLRVNGGVNSSSAPYRSSPSPPTTPAAPKVYPEYYPKKASSPVTSLAGAIIAGAMMYRAIKQ